MVLKTTLCSFSGLRIYPGKGVLFIRTDCTQKLFLSKKCRRLYNNRKRPVKLAWTAAYRKAHKKDQVTEASRKKRRGTTKPTVRQLVGVPLEVLQKKRNEKPEVRQASREAAVREVKERAKKAKAEKAQAAAGKGKLPSKVPKMAKARGVHPASTGR